MTKIILSSVKKQFPYSLKKFKEMLLLNKKLFSEIIPLPIVENRSNAVDRKVNFGPIKVCSRISCFAQVCSHLKRIDCTFPKCCCSLTLGDMIMDSAEELIREFVPKCGTVCPRGGGLCNIVCHRRESIYIFL